MSTVAELYHLILSYIASLYQAALPTVTILAVTMFIATFSSFARQKLAYRRLLLEEAIRNLDLYNQTSCELKSDAATPREVLNRIEFMDALLWEPEAMMQIYKDVVKDPVPERITASPFQTSIQNLWSHRPDLAVKAEKVTQYACLAGLLRNHDMMANMEVPVARVVVSKSFDAVIASGANERRNSGIGNGASSFVHA